MLIVIPGNTDRTTGGDGMEGTEDREGTEGTQGTTPERGRRRWVRRTAIALPLLLLLPSSRC